MLLIGLVDHFKLFLTFLFRSNNAELVAQTTEVKSSKWVGIAICVTVVVVSNLILTGAMVIYYSQTVGITTIMPEITLTAISMFPRFYSIQLSKINLLIFFLEPTTEKIENYIDTQSKPIFLNCVLGLMQVSKYFSSILDLSNSLDLAVESTNKVAGLIMELLNKTNIMNSLSNIEFDTEWLESQTVGPGPTATTTETTTIKTTTISIKNQIDVHLMDIFNHTLNSNETLSKIGNSTTYNLTEIVIKMANSTLNIPSFALNPHTISTTTKKPSVFEGILKPILFENIPNASLMIVSGLAMNESELPVEMNDLHYDSSIVSCQDLEPYYLEVWGATGGLMLEHVPFLCGGLHINKDTDIIEPSKECHSIGLGIDFILD